MKRGLGQQKGKGEEIEREQGGRKGEKYEVKRRSR